jgi:putative Mn2+ efflux pump MntP
VTRALVLAGIVLPLAVDTFALAAALGVAGLPGAARRRTTLVLAAFEAGMPIVGALAGSGVSAAVGRFAGWGAIAFLLLAGGLMLRPGGEAKEEARLKLLARAQGFAVLDLGIAISVDELAVGFGLGLVGLSLPVAVVWIGVQAFLAAEIGLRLGSRLGEELRERAEQLAGVALVAMAAVLLVLDVVRAGP